MPNPITARLIIDRLWGCGRAPVADGWFGVLGAIPLADILLEKTGAFSSIYEAFRMLMCANWRVCPSEMACCAHA